MIADLWPEHPTAILAMPDERKGERLVLLTTFKGASKAEVSAHLKRKQAAELMAPAEVRVIEAMPLLGSGKTDYVALGRLARGELGQEAA
jgi:acyl-[acyl-carrier-protein]-phospholipid O-acyltransferase/long-chain-fatty-acid--[acyl-carrier-protein] ligase